MPPTSALPEIRGLKLLILLLSVGVSPEEGRPEESSVHRRLVADDRVLLIVPGIACNCHHCIAPSWQLLEVQKVHRSSAHQRLLRIVKHMCQSVHPDGVVAGVDTHSLLTHRTLIGITRGLYTLSLYF